MFQFQNGAIKRQEFFNGGWASKIGFNSKMVRLKVGLQNQCRMYGTFQFQNGAIKSVIGYVRHYGIAGFNSKMVRLKAVR